MLRGLPEGYVESYRGRCRIIARRLELEEMAGLLAPHMRDSVGHPVEGGRGGTRRVQLSGGKTVYLRKYLRGGMMRHVNYDRYFVRPPRPLRELVATEAARVAACRVPLVTAVAIVSSGPFYRGWIVTEAVSAVATFAEALDGVGEQKRARLLQSAGTAVRGLHEAGVYHSDLTGSNILVDRAGEVAIVDFDRAYVGRPGNRKRQRAGLDRLWRSLVKLARLRVFDLDESERRWLDGGYAERTGNSN